METAAACQPVAAGMTIARSKRRRGWQAAFRRARWVAFCGGWLSLASTAEVLAQGRYGQPPLQPVRHITPMTNGFDPACGPSAPFGGGSAAVALGEASAGYGAGGSTSVGFGTPANGFYANGLMTSPALPGQAGTDRENVQDCYRDYRSATPVDPRLYGVNAPGVTGRSAAINPYAALHPPVAVGPYAPTPDLGYPGTIQPHPYAQSSPYGGPMANPPLVAQAEPWVAQPALPPGPSPISPGGFSAPQAYVTPDYAVSDLDCQLYTPFVSMAYLGGETPATGYSNLFVPLLQSHTNLLFADLRGLFNDDSVWQGSFGGGYRQIVGDQAIVGLYTFYDYRWTQFDDQFQQFVVGTEFLTVNHEARMNGYIPVGNGGGAGGGTTTAVFQNGGIWLLGQSQGAFGGVDAEVGTLLYGNATRSFELRAFAGGYAFQSIGTGPNLNGVATRLESRLYDLPWLGDGSRLEAGVISTYDDVRDLEVTAMVLLRVALGRSNCPRSLSLLERRMLDRVVRQSDLLTTATSSAAEPGLAQINGRPFTSVVTVNQGDNLQTAVETAPADSLVIVNGGGTNFSVPNGVNLQPGQTVLGSGAPVQVVGANTGRLTTLTIPGPTPVIERPNILGPTVTAATGSAIISVNVQGGETGILVNNVNNVTVENVNIYDQCCDGFVVTNSADVVLRNVSIDNTQRFGIQLQNTTNVLIENVTLSNNQHTSLIADQGTNTVINGLTVDAANTAHDPLLIRTQTDGTFSNITINNSGFNAFVLEDSSQMSVNNLVINNSTGSGAVIRNGNVVALTGLTVNTAGVSGLVVDGGDFVTLNAALFDQVPNVIEFVNAPTNLSGGGNNASGFTTLSSGAVGSGSYLFDSPNASAP